MAEEPVKPKGRGRKPQPAATSLFEWALEMEQEREEEPVGAAFFAFRLGGPNSGSLRGFGRPLRVSSLKGCDVVATPVGDSQLYHHHVTV